MKEEEEEVGKEKVNQEDKEDLNQLPPFQFLGHPPLEEAHHTAAVDGEFLEPEPKPNLAWRNAWTCRGICY